MRHRHDAGDQIVHLGQGLRRVFAIDHHHDGHGLPRIVHTIARQRMHIVQSACFQMQATCKRFKTLAQCVPSTPAIGKLFQKASR